MSEFGSSSGRAILNANRGVSNVIKHNVIKTDLQRVTNALFNNLSHHYGPYSGFAAVDDDQPLVETNFTKDGIGIVRATEFASPQEEWVRKTIAYIGTKMETSVGDGTTSAMMFTCAMLKHMSEHIDEIKPISHNKLRNSFDLFVNVMKSVIQKKYTYHPYDPQNDENGLDTDRIYKIVYNQVYTSSHGDTELAEALARMYTKIPKELWERMTYERCRYESEGRFKVVESGGQYQVNCKVWSTSMLNKDLCTWYDSQTATFICMNDSIRCNSPEWEKIMHAIDNADVDHPVAILSHTLSDNESYDLLAKKVEECDKAGKPFAMFSFDTREYPKINDFVAINLIGEQDARAAVGGDACIMKNVHVTYKSNKLILDNLYQVPDEFKNKQERVHVIDGKHSNYTDVLETWKKKADFYARQADTQQDREMGNHFMKMYVKLRYNKTHTVEIHGNAYDNVAFVDVLDDAIRAASRALTHGATYSNNRSLYLAVEDYLNHGYRYDNNVRDNEVVKWFARMVKLSLDDMSQVVLNRLHPSRYFRKSDRRDFSNWWFHHSVDLLQYDTKDPSWFDFRPWRDVSNTFHSARTESDLIDAFRHRIICQPSNSDTTMLERFGEIALKFILTECIIIRGGAYVNETNKKGK